MTTKFKTAQPITEDQRSMMQVLLDAAKKTRESHRYSGDEKMLPMAIIYKPDGAMTMMMLTWANDKEKYQMARMANFTARKEKAASLSFVTDTRWVEGEKFAEHFKIANVKTMGIDAFQKVYHRILNEHGGEIKNFPREIWNEAVTVFSNGPQFPLTVQMAPYVEGPHDTIKWLEAEMPKHDGYKSDLLTDWWA